MRYPCYLPRLLVSPGGIADHFTELVTRVKLFSEFLNKSCEDFVRIMRVLGSGPALSPRTFPKNLITHPGLPAGDPDPVLKPPLPAIRVINHHRRPLAGHVTEKQRLLYAVQAAALVQATLVHQRAGLTIHFHVTAAAGRGVPMTGFRLPVDQGTKPAVVLILGCRRARRRTACLFHQR